MWVGQQREGGAEGAGERAKVGLKSTRKGFYCSGVTACLRTCAPKRKMFLKKKKSLQQMELCEDVATAN